MGGAARKRGGRRPDLTSRRCRRWSSRRNRRRCCAARGRRWNAGSRRGCSPRCPTGASTAGRGGARRRCCSGSPWRPERYAAGATAEENVMRDARVGGAGPMSVVVRRAARRVAAAWREVVDPATGGALFICPGCWPEAGAYWRARPNAGVRVLAARPEWAQCGVCDPERSC